MEMNLKISSFPLYLARLALVAAAVASVQPAYADTNDYSFVYRSDRKPLYSNKNTCDTNTGQVCVNFADCYGVRLYSTKLAKNQAIEILNTNPPLVVYYSGTSNQACQFNK